MLGLWVRKTLPLLRMNNLNIEEPPPSLLRPIECHHNTLIIDGGGSSRCASCGLIIYQHESRPCGECKHYFKRPLADYSGCSKKLMAVNHNTKVSFKVGEGSCFE